MNVNEILSKLEDILKNFEVGLIGILVSAVIGGIVNSKLEWVGFKKQKRAEVKMASGESIHNQISEIIIKLNDIYPYFINANDSNGTSKALWVQNFIIPKGMEINSSFARLTTVVNFNMTILKVDMQSIESIANTLSDVIVELDEEYLKDEIYFKGKQGMILDMINKLTNLNIIVRNDVFSEIYTSKKRKEQNDIIENHLKVHE